MLKIFLNNKDFYNQNGILGCIKDAKSNKVKTNLSTKLVAIPTTSGPVVRLLILQQYGIKIIKKNIRFA